MFLNAFKNKYKLYQVLIRLLVLFLPSFSQAAAEPVVKLLKPSGISYSYNKIQKAIDKAQPGDRVLVRPGVHFEILKIVGKKGIRNKPIIIEGTNAETCIIDGAIEIFSKKGFQIWKKDAIGGKKCYSLDLKLKAKPGIARDVMGVRVWCFGNELEFVKSSIPLGIYYDKKQKRLYIRGSNSFDPNKVPILISRDNYTVLIKNSSFIVLRNLYIRNGGASSIQITCSTNIELSSLIINGGQRGIYFKDLKSEKGVKSSNVLIRDCKIIENYDSKWFWSDFKTQKNRKMEGAGIYVHRAGSQISISNCQIAGFFDGISVTSQEGFNNFGLTIKGNTIHNIVDDGIELDCKCTNCMVYKNTIYDTFCGISLAPSQGPIYIYRNVVLADKRINFDRAKKSRSYGVVLKIGGTFKKPTSNIILYNNTLCGRRHVVGIGYRDGVVENLNFFNNILMTDSGYVLYFHTKTATNLNFIRNLYYKRKKRKLVVGWKDSFRGNKKHNCFKYGIASYTSSKIKRVDRCALEADPKIAAPFDHPPNPRLLSNSPAINAGIDLNCLSLPDCITIKDGFIDIGAVEYIK